MRPDSSSSRRLQALLSEDAWARRLAVALAGKHDGDDLAQTVLAKASARGGAEPPGPVRALWGRALRFEAANLRRSAGRRSKRERLAARPELEPELDPAILLERTEQRRRLAEQLIALPEEQRTALILHYEEGLTAEEIGRRLEVSPSTVRSRLSRGRGTLRERLERVDPDWRQGIALLAGLKAPSASLLPVLALSTWMMKSVWIAAGCLSILGMSWIWNQLPGSEIKGPNSPEPRPVEEVSSRLPPEFKPPDSAAKQRTPVAAPRPDTAAPPIETQSNPAGPEWSRSVTVRALLLGPGGAPEPSAVLAYNWLGESLQTAADADGRCEISLDRGPRRAHSTVHFEAIGPGEQWTFRNLSLDEREHYDLGTLELRSMAVAVGRVVDPMGQPIEGASLVHTEVDPVDPFGEPQLFSAGRSDSDGRFITRSTSSLKANWFVRDKGLRSASKQGEVLLGERLELGDFVAEQTPIASSRYVQILDAKGHAIRPDWVHFRVDAQTRTVEGFGQGLLKLPFDVRDASAVEIFAVEMTGRRFGKWEGPGSALTANHPLPLQPMQEVRARGIRPGGEEVELRSLRVEFLNRALGEFEGPEIYLPDHRVRVTAQANGYTDSSILELESLPKGELIFPFDREATSWNGRVSRGGRPVTGVTCTVFSESPARVWTGDLPGKLTSRRVSTASTSEDGTFQFESDPNSNCWLLVEPGTEREWKVSLRGLDPKEPLEIEWPESGQLMGRVTGHGGALPRYVAAYRGGFDGRTVEVTPEGTYRFEDLMPGGWMVRQTGAKAKPRVRGGLVLPDETPFDFSLPDVEVRAGETVEHDVRLDAAGEAELQIGATLDGRAFAGMQASISVVPSLHQLYREPLSLLLDEKGQATVKIPSGARHRLSLTNRGRMVFSKDLERAAFEEIVDVSLDLKTAELELRLGTGESSPYLTAELANGFQVDWLFDLSGEDPVLRRTIPAGTVRLRRFANGPPGELGEVGPFWVEPGETLVVELP